MKRPGLSAVIGILVALFAGRSASGVNVLMVTTNSGSLTTIESNLAKSGSRGLGPPY